MLFFIIFLLLLISLVAQWKKNVSKWLIRHYGLSKHNKSGKKSIQKVLQYYNENVGLNGKYYLWKLYLYEFSENWIQFINLKQLFLCTLPIEWTSVFCVALIVESSYRALFMSRTVDPSV